MVCLILELLAETVRGHRSLLHITRCKPKSRSERIQRLNGLIVQQGTTIAQCLSLPFGYFFFFKVFQTVCRLLGIMLHLLHLIVCAIVQSTVTHIFVSMSVKQGKVIVRTCKIFNTTDKNTTKWARIRQMIFLFLLPLMLRAGGAGGG